MATRSEVRFGVDGDENRVLLIPIAFYSRTPDLPMSEHGRTTLYDKEMPPGLRTPKSVSEHRGTAHDFLYRHQRHAKHILRRGRGGLLEIVPHLLHRLSDTRTLGLAWDYLAEKGGQAPGPDGLRYGDFDSREKWKKCRELRDRIRTKSYMTGDEFLRWIPKRSGNGSRPLIIQNIEERVVQRAAVEILQPLLDPRFDPLSFGFRPKRGTLEALAWAERLAVDGNRWVWVAVDVKDAFCNIPISRLLSIVRKNLPDEELVFFIQTVLSNAKLPGLRQGGPLSPLLLNLYLDHVVDRKWRKLFPLIPLIRYADDILLLCKSRKEAFAGYKALVKLLSPAGLTLKEDALNAVRRLDSGERVHYMGFEIGQGDERLFVGLTKSAWAGLADNLEDCHEAPASAMRAVQSIIGWLNDRAVCFHDLDVDDVYHRVQKVARQYCFDELLYPSEVYELAEKVAQRWENARLDARGTADSRRHIIED